MPFPISRLAASVHAERITAGLDPTDHQLLADDPHDAVAALYGIDIVIHPPGHTISGGCGVHGLYTPGDPPRIEITQSISRRRDGFTILHEFGHHLSRSDATIVDALYELPDQDKRKSHELVADAIAGRLLVTDADAHEAFDGGVTASAMRNLFHTTRASREACCIRGADALTQRGAVMLLRDNVAVFTAHRSTPWHVARSTPQAGSGLLAEVANGGHRTGQTTVQFATGNTSTPMYADAIACDDGWVFAVLTLDRPAAGGLTVPLARFATEDDIECPECGFTFAPRGKSCVCGDHKCPNGHCGCDKGPPTKLCQSCFLQKHIELFEGGSEHCKDCSSQQLDGRRPQAVLLNEPRVRGADLGVPMSRTPTHNAERPSAEKPEKSVRYKRKDLTPEQRIRMLVECGGRCALCNDYLLEGGLTSTPVPFGELAHMIGLQPNKNSPRGLDDPMGEDERNDPSNLMFVCESNHAEIDKSGSRDMFPIDWLRQRKADHIARIKFLTSLNPQHPTVPLRLLAKVRDDNVEVDQIAVANAVMYSAMRYPKFRLADRHEIEIDLRGIAGEKHATPEYYAAARARIDEVFDHTLAAGWTNGDITHMSVFAFARIPILVYLGTKLGDHVPVDVYQRNRITQNWIWPSKDGDLPFTVDVPPTTDEPTEAVLIINASGTIDRAELPDEVAGLAVLTVAASTAHPNVVDSPSKLADFTRALHELIGKIERDGYKTVNWLHVFAAAGLACSVTLGRVFDDDTHPILAIYDRQDGTGYRLGMEVGHR